MKKITLAFAAVIISLAALAQNDKMYKHSGEQTEVKIIKVGEWTISYSYPGETAEQTIGKYAVAKIEYASGRTEEVTEKITVAGEDDWEKVVIIEDKGAAIGLKKMDEIRGKTSGWIGVHTAGSADKKSLKKLKMAAAAMGAQFVLMTSDKDNQFTNQSIKKGIAYSYK
jgi:hypothetical protein